MTRESGEPSITINMPVIVDSSGAIELRRMLLDAQMDGANIILDGREVTKIGTAGAQVLLACVPPVAVDSHTVRFAAPSEPLKAALADLGLEHSAFNWDPLKG